MRDTSHWIIISFVEHLKLFSTDGCWVLGEAVAWDLSMVDRLVPVPLGIIEMCGVVCEIMPIKLLDHILALYESIVVCRDI